MTIKSKSPIIYATPAEVFAYMDNIGNTGMHMTKSSMPMMGSKLELKQLSENATGLNLAPLYANWCLNNMLNDSKKMLEAKQNSK